MPSEQTGEAPAPVSVLTTRVPDTRNDLLRDAPAVADRRGGSVAISAFSSSAS